MTSKDLTTDQAKQLQARLGDSFNFLYRLHRRMEQTFAPGDELFRLVTEAYHALHALNVELHYLSCKGGVARPPKE